jgi:tRNA modification GTPase
MIDEGFVVFMKGPRSFTAEDVVEIHCHGSGLVLGRVMESCLSAGARLAQPGEFTKRAFLNGRLDLTQAEAVIETIRARSEAGLKIAQRHLRGDLGRLVDRLRTRLVGILAQVEAGIDFVEEDISFISRQALTVSLQEVLDEIRVLLRTAESGRVLREGARVVIVGRPNVGKSSLLNRLVGEERAIVTDIPGTTRDVIEESVVLDGLMITLVDTAGLRDTTDRVEQEGIKRTRAVRDEGDLVLQVLDAAELAGQDIEAHLGSTGERTDLHLINKSDLVDAATLHRLTALIEQQTKARALPVSARTGWGFKELKESIRSRLSYASLEASEGVLLTNVRHRLALERTASSLREALDATGKALAPEFVAMDLRGAAEALGEVTGVITSDEILNHVFAQFCVGK